MEKIDMLVKIFEQLHNDLPLLSIECSSDKAIFYNYTHLHKFPLLKSKDIVSSRIGTQQQLINRLMVILSIKARNHQLEDCEEKFICKYKRFIATSRLAEFLPYFSSQSQAEVQAFLLLRKLA